MAEQPAPCRRTEARLTDYLEDALNGEQRARISRHLAACAGCRATLDELQHTIALLGRLRGTPPPEAQPTHTPPATDRLPDRRT